MHNESQHTVIERETVARVHRVEPSESLNSQQLAQPEFPPYYHRPFSAVVVTRSRLTFLSRVESSESGKSLAGDYGNCDFEEMMKNGDGYGGEIEEYIRKHHKHEISDTQCTSVLVKHIKAPVNLVWSLVRRFDQPQKYKPFISRCVVQGDLEIGSVREVDVKSGLPATTSTERLELLDDNEHVLSIKIVGGDHRLKNYSSVVSLHPEIIEGSPGTMVVESFIVDIPEGNTMDETCYFVEALIKCNLKSLSDVSERLAVLNRTEQIDRMSIKI